MAKKVRQAGRDITEVGSQITRLAAPMALIAGASVKMAADFESSFAGVKKTVNETATTSFAKLESEFRKLATSTLPVAVNELNKIAEVSGQVGVKADGLVEFTTVMAKLGVTTDIASADAAKSLARFANITDGLDGTNIERVGDVIVDLGNNFASTESEIVEFALRLAAAGKEIGLSQDEILAFSAVLSSAGIKAEAGGTAFSRLFIDLAASVDEGGARLQKFAAVAGQTSSEFAKAFKEDSSKAIEAFVVGLSNLDKQGISSFKVLKELGLNQIRVRDASLRVASASDLLGDALKRAAEQAQNGGALNEEAAKRFETFASQLIKLANQIIDIGITLGQALIPVLLDLMEVFKPMLESLASMVTRFGEWSQTTRTVIVVIGLLVAALGPLLIAIGALTAAAGQLPIAFAAITVAGKVFLAWMAKALIAAKAMFLQFAAANPILAGLVVFVAAFAATNFILEMTGMRDAITGTMESMMGLRRTMDGKLDPPIQAEDIRLIGKANDMFREQGKSFEFSTKGLKEARKAMNDHINAMRESQGVAKVGESVTKKVDKTTQDLTTTFKNLNDTFDELDSSVLGLVDSLGTGGLEKEITRTNKALEILNAQGRKLSAEGLRSVTDIIKTAKQEGVELNGELGRMAKSIEEVGRKALANLPPMERMVFTTDEWEDTIKGLPEEISDVTAELPKFGTEANAALLGLPPLTTTWNEALDRSSRATSGLRGLMDDFGVSAESALGKAIRFVEKFLGTIQSGLGTVNKLIGLFTGGRGGGILGGITGIGGGGVPGVGGIGGIGGLIGGLFGGGGGAATVGGGAAAGAAGLGGGAAGGGAGILGSLGGFFTNPLTAIIGGGIAGGFGIAKLIGKIFKKANVKDAIKDNFGTAISKGLLESIEGIKENRGDIETALQVSLGGIFGEALADGTADLDMFTERIADTFSFLERGQVSASEAQRILNDNVAQLIPVMDQLGPAGEFQILRMIRAAERLGVDFEGMTTLAEAFGIELEGQAETSTAAMEDTQQAAKDLTAVMTTDVVGGLRTAAEQVGVLKSTFRDAARAAGSIRVPDVSIPSFREVPVPRRQRRAAAAVPFTAFGPTNLLVGEAGPERVSFDKDGRGQRNGGTTTLVVPVMIGDKEVARAVVPEIERRSKQRSMRIHPSAVRNF
jgi:TP901 family phage tail tape measure protein